MSPLYACPLSWSAALRRNAREPTGQLRMRVLEWLRHHGWQQTAEPHPNGRLHLDPLERDLWFLAFAVRRQALRDAQRTLSPLGWEMSGGAKRQEDGAWLEVYELRCAGRGGYFTVTRALKLEGLVMPPALPRVRPMLRLIRGGGSAA